MLSCDEFEQRGHDEERHPDSSVSPSTSECSRRSNDFRIVPARHPNLSGNERCSGDSDEEAEDVEFQRGVDRSSETWGGRNSPRTSTIDDRNSWKGSFDSPQGIADTHRTPTMTSRCKQRNVLVRMR